MRPCIIVVYPRRRNCALCKISLNQHTHTHIEREREPVRLMTAIICKYVYMRGSVTVLSDTS